MTETTILFYCKDCQRVVLNPKKHPKKYEYSCIACGKNRVSFGTKQAICDFFQIKDAMLEKSNKLFHLPCRELSRNKSGYYDTNIT